MTSEKNTMTKGRSSEEPTIIKINHIDRSCTCNRSDGPNSRSPAKEERVLPFLTPEPSSTIFPASAKSTAPALFPPCPKARNATPPETLQRKPPEAVESLARMMRQTVAQSMRESLQNQRPPFKYEDQQTPRRVSMKSDESTISSDGSEATLSVVDINDYKLPLLPPRQHGPHCALEVSVLEKHAQGCMYKKIEREGRSPMDDKVGSYDVVNRIIYPTCAGKTEDGRFGYGDAIRNSAKGFRLNDPENFGKDLKENRSRIDALPLLPDYSSCVFLAETPKGPFDQMGKKHDDNLEVLSVYIRMDKNEKVPDGFQKMHYRGDSCKLHDPTERSKQIMALQKVINETSSGAHLDRSAKAFSPAQQEPYIMAAVTSPAKLSVVTSPTRVSNKVSPSKLPKTLYEPVDMEESEESLSSYLAKKQSSQYVDSLDMIHLPHNENNNDAMEPTRGPSGLFGCFKKRSKKLPETFAEEERRSSGRRVTHSDNQPKRRSSGSPGNAPNKLSNQYLPRKK